jgi:glycosyltransferase involved in cell wall biosynthesis
MVEKTILVVGAINRSTGGIAQYTNEQIRHLQTNNEIIGIDVSAPEVKKFLLIPYAGLKVLKDVIKLVHQDSPDIVHLHVAQGISFYRETLFGLIATYLWDVGLVLHIHGSSFDEFLESGGVLSNMYQSTMFHKADKVICLSSYWKGVLSSYTDQNKLEVLPNAVDVRDYSPEETVSHELRISYISDLVKRKGVQEFSNAIEQFGNNDQVQIDIAGKGPLSFIVQDLSERYENVTYHGYVSENSKQDILNKSDIFVLPSYAEGLPIVILEAMAGGNAIVSTNVGSIPELIGDDNGILIQPKDEEVIGESINKLSSDRGELAEIKRQNRELVEESYSWEAHKRDLTKIYNSAL